MEVPCIDTSLFILAFSHFPFIDVEFSLDISILGFLNPKINVRKSHYVRSSSVYVYITEPNVDRIHTNHIFRVFILTREFLLKFVFNLSLFGKTQVGV